MVGGVTAVRRQHQRADFIAKKQSIRFKGTPRTGQSVI